MIEEQVTTIRLYGKLGAKFGRVHRAVVQDTNGAIRYLCAMVPGFDRELMESADKGVGYSCFVGDLNLKEDQLDFPAGKQDIRIAPIIMGSKSGGLFSVVVGAVLIGAAFATGGATLGATGLAFSGTLGAFTFGLGALMMVTGLAQSVVPQQEGVGTQDAPANTPSYNFNGVVNTTAEGNPWPLGHGEMITGGAIVSVSVYSEDQQ